jgi:hypothetical protein
MGLERTMKLCQELNSCQCKHTAAAVLDKAVDHRYNDAILDV